MSGKPPPPQVISPAAFDVAMAGLEPRQRLAVAVSGGPDSLALLLLAADWAKEAGRDLVALTVDHRLRPEAADEALYVAGVAAKLRIPHHILVWEGEKPGSGISAAARDERYRLLLGWCRAEGFQDLLVAHHQGDQAETFLMRLARGSGVDGLSAMAPVREVGDGIRILRPLLDFSKADLEQTVAAAGLRAVDDPSNRSPRYERVRVRERLSDLSEIGLDAGVLADTARRLARARAALEHMTDEFLNVSSELSPEGVAFLTVDALAETQEEIGLRALAGLLRSVSGARYPGRLEPLERLYARITGGKPWRGETLAGCQLAPWRQGRVAIWREPAAALGVPDLTLAAGEQGIWDRRFEVRLHKGEGRIKVSALGEKGLLHLREAGISIPEREQPRMALRSLPALRREGILVAVPLLGYGAGDVVADTRFPGPKNRAS